VQCDDRDHADKQHPSAKHEGPPPEIDSTREHPSDILDYFPDKHDSVNRTARALTENGLTFVAAQNPHRQ
jgi:hypothetical protein